MTVLKAFRLPAPLTKRLAHLAKATHRSERFYVVAALQYYLENDMDAQIAKDRFQDPRLFLEKNWESGLAYKVVYLDQVVKDLRNLDKATACKVLNRIETYLVQDPKELGKALTGDFRGYWRYRWGDLRHLQNRWARDSDLYSEDRASQGHLQVNGDSPAKNITLECFK